jgi:hypothetical protein
VPTTIASLLAAAAWDATRASGRLPSWRFGAALGAGFVPLFVASLVTGPLGDRAPEPALLVALLAALVGVPAALGAWAGGLRAAVFMGLAVAPTGLLNAMFFLGGGINAWSGLFAVSLLAIWTASGAWMDLFVRRFSRATEPAHDAAAPA